MKTFKYYIYALRPQQWIKNLFIFLPLIFAKQIMDLPSVQRSFWAFLIFSSVASGVYLMNDLIDFQGDKAHPMKRLRPLASGRVSVGVCSWLAATLGLGGLGVGFLLNPVFGLILGVYVLFNLIYSFFLKNMVIIDVMCIGFFFILRVLAGASVIRVEVSHWLLICTGLLALFLGFNKRRQELVLLGKRSKVHRKVLEEYSPYFIDQMIAVLTASTVIFYTLYTVDARTYEVFGTRNLLFTVPFVYYGIFRYLYLVHKRRKGGDPTRVVLTDQKLIINLILWLIVAITVTNFKF